MNKMTEQEWLYLQQQYDSYEKFSLMIKLINVLIFTGLIIMSNFSYWVGLPVVLLWLQDGIWKTFQARIETRLLAVEQQIALNLNIDASQKVDSIYCNSSEPFVAFQFNQQFLNQRKTGVSLVAEYLKTALRPTVAFPHVVLFLGLIIMQ